jgi:hypothetical protein
MVKTIDVLTRPTPAAIPPSRPEATKIASLPMDTPFTTQGRREFERRGIRGWYIEAFKRPRTKLGIVFTILPWLVDDSADHPMPIIHDIDQQTRQIHPG